jgi:molecular chaperone GrpE
MSKKNKKNQNDEAKAKQEEILEEENVQEQAQKPVKEEEADLDPQKKIEELEAQLEHEKKEYLFLMADFENFRKRTLNEKAELIKNGAERAMRDLLPVIDDLERAMDARISNSRERDVMMAMPPDVLRSSWKFGAHR